MAGTSTRQHDLRTRNESSFFQKTRRPRGNGIRRGARSGGRRGAGVDRRACGQRQRRRLESACGQLRAAGKLSVYTGTRFFGRGVCARRRHPGFRGGRCGVWRVRCRAGTGLRRKSRQQGVDPRAQTREPVARGRGGSGADRAYRAVLHRRLSATEIRRNHFDSGWRGRRGELRDSDRQTYRRARDHHRECGESRLPAHARRGPDHRLQRAGFHQGRVGLRRGVRHRGRRCHQTLIRRAETRRTRGIDCRRSGSTRVAAQRCHVVAAKSRA